MAGDESKLAGFLTGVQAQDQLVVPIGSVKRSFHDLKNRADQLVKILQLVCQPSSDPSQQSPLEVLQSVKDSIGSRVH